MRMAPHCLGALKRPLLSGTRQCPQVLPENNKALGSLSPMMQGVRALMNRCSKVHLRPRVVQPIAYTCTVAPLAYVYAGGLDTGYYCLGFPCIERRDCDQARRRQWYSGKPLSCHEMTGLIMPYGHRVLIMYSMSITCSSGCQSTAHSSGVVFQSTRVTISVNSCEKQGPPPAVAR